MWQTERGASCVLQTGSEQVKPATGHVNGTYVDTNWDKVPSGKRRDIM